MSLSKDMAKKFLDEPDPKKACVDLMNDLNTRTKKLLEERKVKSDSAFLAVLKEIDQLYKTIVKIVNANSPKLNPEGYMLVMKDQFPKIADALETFDQHVNNMKNSPKLRALLCQMQKR